MTRQRGLVLMAMILVASGSVHAQVPGSRRLPDWAANAWMLRRHVGPPWALVGGTVVDVTTGEVIENATIVIQGDVIRSVGHEPPPPRAATIDISGRWVIPGLFDLHAHVIPPSMLFPDAKPPDEALADLLAHGVTTIRLLPLYSESAGDWCGRINHNALAGPTIIPASGVFEREPQRTLQGFGDAGTARAWVRKEALLGSRWIKVYNSMDADSLRAIVETAREHGMRVCGHALDVPPHEASAIGMATIEHMTSMPLSCLADGFAFGEDVGMLERVAFGWRHLDPAKADALLETLRANGTGWVPTLVETEAIVLGRGHGGRPFADEATAEGWAEALDRSAALVVSFHRMGGLVGIGTDFPINGVAPGSSVHRELELLVERGGATPLEALRMATTSSACLLGFGELLGRVAPGALADLVILDADPRERISNVRRIVDVYHAGRRVERPRAGG